MAAVMLFASAVVSSCGPGSEAASSEPGCPAGAVRYVGQGLTLLVPDGVDPDVWMDADQNSVHFESGVNLTLDGHSIQVWRSGQQPSDAGTGFLSTKPASVGTLFVRSDLERLNQCIVDSLSYDQSRDAADE